jgi:hypothetical protein
MSFFGWELPLTRIWIFGPLLVLCLPLMCKNMGQPLHARLEYVDAVTGKSSANDVTMINFAATLASKIGNYRFSNGFYFIILLLFNLCRATRRERGETGDCFVNLSSNEVNH